MIWDENLMNARNAKVEAKQTEMFIIIIEVEQA